MAKPTYIQPNMEEWLGKFSFHTEIKIRYSETDMSGHVNNTSYLVYFEQARTEYWQFLEVMGDDLLAVTADIWCHYHAEAFYPETLKVGVRIARIGTSSFDLEYYISSTRDNRIVATGAGTIVLLDKHTKQKALVPQQIREQFTHYLG
ncbi:acyl-CoA thioesterase [Paenibacillus sp. N1-5-1-14]|uniref:acyl-CoA thioesterase n=1 Tax=Paenibacillus radicibacter TaxID=2972488 RepID=UPI0021597745|nr:thioesterase family protein [Paenibacillus radicibacter]MCR8642718.1 acyl-CoA thioesterase [Paenibacillus radicibacter]